MAERVAAMDWSQTPLGAMESWPSSLRVAVDLCLGSPFPMHVWWGPELINIYNDAHVPILGRPRHPQALGRPAREIWADVWPLLAPQVAAVMERGEVTWNAGAHVVSEGHSFPDDAWFTWSYSPIRDETGRIAGLMGISIEDTAGVLAEHARDRLKAQRHRERVDERASADKALRESNMLLRSISDSTGDAIFAKDREGRFRFANPATLALVGRPLEQVLGRTDAELLEDAAVAQTLMANDRRIMESGVGADLEEIIPHPDGTRRVWFSRKAPQRDRAGKVVGLLGVSRDITNQKQAEAVLLREADELARSNLELDRFAHVASHDLQEPMRTVRNFAQLLNHRYGTLLEGDGQEYLDFIFKGVHRMQSLVVDLLAFSRVGSEGAALTPVDCNDVLKKVLNSLQVSIDLNHAVVTADTLPTVCGDATQLGQVFQNLLANAIKFHGCNPPEIHVSAKPTEREWILSVKDNGIGIAAEYFERIFVIFQRLHTIEEYGGTGLGLAICKKIVERHEGRMWVESTLGHGSTFYFSIQRRGEL